MGGGPASSHRRSHEHVQQLRDDPGGILGPEVRGGQHYFRPQYFGRVHSGIFIAAALYVIECGNIP